MALADWQTNALVGPQGGGDFNIFDLHATQRYAVGTRVERADGNVYVYGHFGEDCAAGTVVGPDTSEGGELEGVDDAVLAPADCVTTTDCTIGSKYIEMTNAGIVADEHAGGYIAIVSGTGVGYTYRIKGNTATGDPASGTVRIELYDPLQVALDATSDVHIHGSKFAQLIKATGAGGENSIAIGVTCAAVDFSEQMYAWVQVKGVCCPLADGTLVKGGGITLSDGVAGAIQPLSGGSTAVADLIDEREIGQVLIPDASTGQALCQVDFE